MTNKELVANAVAYLQKTTCYMKGMWCERLTQSEYDYKCQQYPDNKKYGNEKYINSDVYAADCICWIKQLLAGGNVNRRLSYGEMATNPLGDCTNKQFYDKLYDCCEPSQAKPGYALATTGHAALYVGNGQWMDFNYTSGQNGVALHTGFSGTNFKCGKIPGIAYENPEPVQDEVKDFLAWTANYLYNLWKENKK